MSSILRRFTSQLDQASSGSGEASHTLTSEHLSDGQENRKLMSTVSFNDFSMHVMMDEDHADGHIDKSGLNNSNRSVTQPVSIPTSQGMDAQDFNAMKLDKIKTSSPLIGSKSMSIPRNSVASIFTTPKAAMASVETPRSSLDLCESSSLPTPRASISSRELDGDESAPVSPRSPRTPGGRRKRHNKIHGLDYYEFCELVRAGSL